MAQLTLKLTETKELPTQVMMVASAIVLTAILAVSLGFAIDTSNMVFVYNNLQGATDIIAVNAASALCSGDQEDTAIQAMTLNPTLYSIDNINVIIANPPPAGIEHAGDSNYVYITLTGEKSNFFNQLVHGEPVAVSATAIATCG